MRFPFLCAVAATALLPSSDAWAFRIKRDDDDWVPSNPHAFEVELDFDGAGRYIAPIGMGKPWGSAGNFSFILSTSSPYTAVAAADCATCVAQVGQAPVYDISKSSSAYRQNINQTFEIGRGSVSGEVILESCSFKKYGSTNWTYGNQTVLMIKSTDGVLEDGVSGLVGLGRSTGNDSYISGIINSQAGWEDLLFGFAFNAFNANATAAQSAGTFTVWELNPALFAGKISWQPLVRTTGVPKNMPADWAINFDSYKVKLGSQSITNSGGVAIIDPYFQELRIPQNEAMDFFDNIPGTKMTNDSFSLSWVVPCDKELSLSVTVRNITFRMTKEQLINLDSTGTLCTSLVKGWPDPAVRAYLFGSPFASIAYIAYRAERDQSSDQIGLAPRSAEPADQGVSRTVLIATVAGSVIFTVLVISAILFFYHRRRSSDTPKPGPSGEEQFKTEPFTGGAPHTATTMLPTTMGSSGWIIEQGPIGGQPSEGNVLTNLPASSLTTPQTVDSAGARQSPEVPPMGQSQFTDFAPASASTQHLASSLRTPQSLDSGRSESSSHHLSMRQTQPTDVSALTSASETTPRLEVHHIARPSPSTNQSFYGEHITAFHSVPETRPHRNLGPRQANPAGRNVARAGVVPGSSAAGKHDLTRY